MLYPKDAAGPTVYRTENGIRDQIAKETVCAYFAHMPEVWNAS